MSEVIESKQEGKEIIVTTPNGKFEFVTQRIDVKEGCAFFDVNGMRHCVSSPFLIQVRKAKGSK